MADPSSPPEPLSLESPSIASRVRSLPRALGWAGAGAYLLPAWALVISRALGVYSHDIEMAHAIGLITCLTAGLLGFGLANRPGRPGRVEVDDHGIRLHIRGETKHIVSPMITSAVIVPSSRGCRVEIALEDDTTLSIEAEEPQARALLERIEQSKHAASMTIGMQTPTPVWMALTVFGSYCAHIVLSVVLYELGLYTPWLLAAVPTLSALVTFVLLASTHVVVGDDGIQLRRALGSRFISFDAMQAVALTPDGRLRITLAGGEVVHIGSRSAGHTYASALAKRIDELKSPEHGAAAAAMQQLTRGDRSIAAWREALRGLLSAQPGYRGPRLSPREALEVVVDPSRRVEQRVGAVLALADSGALDDAARKRLRIAADASANPQLRVVLQGAAEDALEDAAIAEAVEADATASDASSA